MNDKQNHNNYGRLVVYIQNLEHLLFLQEVKLEDDEEDLESIENTINKIESFIEALVIK